MALPLALAFTLFFTLFTLSSSTPIGYKGKVPTLDEYAQERAGHQGNPGDNYVSSGEMWPCPAALNRTGAVLYFDPANFKISVIGSTGNVLQKAVSRYQGFLFPFQPAVAGTGALLPELRVQVTSPYSEELTLGVDESYTLSVAPVGTANITAKTVFGVLKGLETFSQLIVHDFTSHVYQISTIEITDAPRLPYRGVMIDTARRFSTTESVFQVIEMMSYYKLNVLHIHFTDTDAWSFGSTKYPNLTRISAYKPSEYHSFTPDDMRQISDHALKHGVMVVPEIDTPGHSYTFCYALPELCVIFKDPNTGQLVRGVLPDPTNIDFWIVIEDIFAEAHSIFPSKQLHIGMDESNLSQWQLSPAVQEFMQLQNYTNVNDVFFYYARRLISINRKYGAQTVAWSPGIGNYPENFNNSYADYPDVHLLTWGDWQGQDWHGTFDQLTGMKAKLILGGPYYANDPVHCAYPYPPTKCFSWESMTSVDPKNFTMSKSPSQADYVIGGEVVGWGDALIADSASILQDLSSYIQGVAENWWSDSKTVPVNCPDETPPEFGTFFRSRRLSAQRCRLMTRGLYSKGQSGDDIFSEHCPVEWVPNLSS